MNSHLSVEEIAALVDEPSQQKAGTEHLKTCERCRHEYTTLSRVRDALAALPDLSPPAGGWEHVRARDLVARRGARRADENRQRGDVAEQDLLNTLALERRLLEQEEAEVTLLLGRKATLLDALNARRKAGASGAAYVFERVLGAWRFVARDAARGRRVVVQFLPGTTVERLRREFELLASLQHPRIVPLLSIGKLEEFGYYTMPFEGESLDAKLAREGSLPVSETIRILTDVADALAYAHAQDVRHGDIRPDSVLVSGDRAQLMDLGVSRAVSASRGRSSLGVDLGTAAYMAPEQVAGDHHVDHRADLYALGVLGYEMLAGRPPLVGATPQETLAQRPDVPPALKALVLRCLETQPADRWQTAADILRQLRAIARQSVVIALRRRAAALAVLGVLAGLVVLVRPLGLPNWVLYAMLGLLGIGLPIMLIMGKPRGRPQRPR